MLCRKEGREGGEQLAPGGEGEMGASLAEAFLPVRPPARSFGCFPCLHSKRRLAKKIRTSDAAGGRLPSRTGLFCHTVGGRQPMLRAVCRTSLQVLLCYAGMESSRAREGSRDQGLPAPSASLPWPHLALSQATPTLSFIPSFICLIHIPSAFAFKNPHPECHSQAASTLSAAFILPLLSPISKFHWPSGE